MAIWSLLLSYIQYGHKHHKNFNINTRQQQEKEQQEQTELVSEDQIYLSPCLVQLFIYISIQ